MDGSTQQSIPGASTSVSGHKDRDGNEKVIDLWPLKKKLKHLMATKETADAARAQFNAAVKAVAEESGLLSSVIKRAVKAHADDKAFDAKREAAQLAMVLTDIGGIGDADDGGFSDSHDTGAAKPTKKGDVKKNGKPKNGTEPELAIGEGAPPAVDPLLGTDLGPKAAHVDGPMDRYLADKEGAQSGAPH